VTFFILVFLYFVDRASRYDFC